MAGFKTVAGPKAANPGAKPVPSPKVKMPRNNPRGTARGPLGFPKPSGPRIKPGKTREYHKIPPVPEPAQEGGLSTGFGDTGMTGES